ncbi:MAG: PD40 domain-containing protein [Salinivirgaceae bacterium]|nr:PD40 domain-containing protein [Salinivirgaceae bacterium]
MTQNLKLFFIIVILQSCVQNDSWKYLEQNPPDNDPVIFAKNIITTNQHEHSAPSISPDEREIYWSVFNKSISPNQTIYYVEFKNDKWSEPQIASFSGHYSDGGPCFSSYGDRIYFYSLRPVSMDSTKLINDIWYVDKNESGWTSPINIGLNYLASYDKWVFSPSVSDKGNIYFAGLINDIHGLYKVQINNDSFDNPILLSEKINSNYDDFNWTPFIAPDESYIIFSSKRKDSKSFNDLYISFRQDKGDWSSPINMGSKINNGSHVRFPYVSPDGKYLFFTRDNGIARDDIFWVSSKIIEDIKPENLKHNNVK